MNKSLYELSFEYLSAIEKIEVNEETGEISGYEELEAIAKEFDDKVENVALFIKNEIAFIEAMKKEERSIADRRKQHERKLDYLMNYVSNEMLTTGKTKIETEKVRLSFRKSESVEIEDADKLTEDYLTVRTTQIPNKTAIKKAIKAGIQVEGAYLATNQNLQIK